ncbi:hypothetical protein B9Z55_004188 [Caenorhabditis nigoni]|nr:hypothetical protein B9Z55_004188 [Caenorhabditis nigoni]
MLGRSATETTENINRASAERGASRKTVQQWFTKFACGDASLEEKKVVEGILKVDHHKTKEMGNCLPSLFGFSRQHDETPMRRSRSSENAMSFTNPAMMQTSSSYVNQLYQHNVIRQRQAEERGKEIDEAKKNRIRGLLDQIPADVFRGDMASTECAICMIDFEPGERIRFLPCMHSFHQECVDEWLLKSFTCPSCLEPVDSTILSSLTAHNMQSLHQITSSSPSTSSSAKH